MIGFECRIANSALENLVHEAMLEAIPDQEMDVNGFAITLKILGSPTIQAENKSIAIALPLGINFSRQAGLFTVQGHGKIHVKIKSDFDVSPDFNLNTKSSITDHLWLEKPVIDFGSLDITVEKLVDLILKHYHDILSHSIDKGLKTRLSLPDIVNHLLASLKRDLSAFDYHGLKIFMQPSEILLEPIANVDGKMVFRGGINTALVCAGKDPFTSISPKLRWVQTLLNDNLSMMHLDVTEEVISDIMCEFVNKQQYGGENLVATSCKVDFAPSKMNLQLSLSSPLKAMVTVDGKPRYNEAESNLYLDKLDINMKASNLIYKLSAPLVNRFLESSFKEKLPIPINAMIKEQSQKNLPFTFIAGGMKIEVNVQNIVVEEMRFDDAGVKALIRIEDFIVMGTMD